jgi:hypothetical protein
MEKGAGEGRLSSQASRTQRGRRASSPRVPRLLKADNVLEMQMGAVTHQRCRLLGPENRAINDYYTDS